MARAGLRPAVGGWGAPAGGRPAPAAAAAAASQPRPPSRRGGGAVAAAACEAETPSTPGQPGSASSFSLLGLASPLPSVSARLKGGAAARDAASVLSAGPRAPEEETRRRRRHCGREEDGGGKARAQRPCRTDGQPDGRTAASEPACAAGRLRLRAQGAAGALETIPARRGCGGGGLARPRPGRAPRPRPREPRVVPRLRGGRRPLPPPRRRAAPGFRVPGAPSWILLFTQAGSEFRTAIPGGVTSEKFFPSAEDPVGAGKLLTQVASRKPARTPAPTGAAALLREAAPHPPRPHGSLGGAPSRGGRAGNHVKPSLGTAALRHPERMLAQLRNIREINSTQCF